METKISREGGLDHKWCSGRSVIYVQVRALLLMFMIIPLYSYYVSSRDNDSVKQGWDGMSQLTHVPQLSLWSTYGDTTIMRIPRSTCGMIT